jgi:hypothetical protein
MSHTLRMVIGCVLPLLLIFFLPLIGISEGATLLIAIVLMFACHLLMIGGHGSGHDHGRSRESNRGGRRANP